MKCRREVHARVRFPNNFNLWHYENYIQTQFDCSNNFRGMDFHWQSKEIFITNLSNKLNFDPKMLHFDARLFEYNIDLQIHNKTM